MKHTFVVLSLFSFLPATSLVAQPTIGGGSCSSATLGETYAVSLSGTQISATGKLISAMEAVGSVTFDGLNKVTFSLSQDNLTAAGTATTWSGTYSVQANCVGQATITTGGTAVLNLALFSGGSNILITGSDSTYTYSGSANDQPSNCSTSMLAGVYSFNGTGYNIASGAATTELAETGLFQFDGSGNVTVNINVVGTPGTSAATGTYSLSSNCVGTATFTISGVTDVVSISVTNATAAAVTDASLNAAIAGRAMVSGSAHQLFGQPQPSSSRVKPEGQPLALLVAPRPGQAEVRS